MALIEYTIDRDQVSGKVTITSFIRRIDPGDEVLMVTGSPNAALEWSAGSPFSAPAAEGVYPLPQANTAPKPLQVVRSTDLTQQVARCGERDTAGNFTAWLQGPGFPGVGSTTEA